MINSRLPLTDAHEILSASFLPTPLDTGLNKLAAHIDDLGSIEDVLIASCDLLHISLDDQTLSLIRELSALAESNHVGSYHNKYHFRDVVACTAFMLDRCGGDLAPSKKFLALIGAASHDLFHDGKTNTLNGTHTPFRLEDRSFNAVKALLERYGISDQALEDLHIMLRSTDTSRNTAISLPSPSLRIQKLEPSFVKQSPSGCFGDAASDDIVHNFCGREDLWRMSIILQVADIMPSSVLSFHHSVKMSTRLEIENAALPATSESFNSFATFVAEPALLALPRKIAAPLLNRLQMILQMMGQPLTIMSNLTNRQAACRL